MTYEGLYRARDGSQIRITSLNPLPQHRSFRAAGGLKKFTLRKSRTITRKVIIVARSTKKSKTVNPDPEEVLDEDLDDLADLEDLDDLEEEDEEETEEPEDEDEDDEEDEDEEPAPKSRKKGKATPKEKAKPSRSRTTDGKIGTSELANHLDVTPRDLRMVLRKMSIPKDDETGRYEWSSLNHKDVKRIIKAVENGAVTDSKKESLDKLKERVAEKNTGSKKTKVKATATPKKKKRRVVEEDEDDE